MNATPDQRDRQIWQGLARSPGLVWNALTLAGVAALVCAAMLWAHDRAAVAPGQVSGSTLTVRVPFDIADALATEGDRQAARVRTPTVYAADRARIDEIITALQNLPRALAEAGGLAGVNPAIRARFALTEETLAALRPAANGQSGAWAQSVAALAERLTRVPLVDAETAQRQTLAGAEWIELRMSPGDAGVRARPDVMINLGGPQAEERLTGLAREAGFEPAWSPAVVAALRGPGGSGATFSDDAGQTQAAQAAAAAKVSPRLVRYQAGQVIIARGQVVTPEKLDVLRAERLAFRQRGPAMERWAAQAGLLGCGVLAALALGAYAATYAPRLWRAPGRLAGAGLLVASAVWLSCVVGVAEPRLMAAAQTAPALAITFLLAVAYDRRTALALGSLAAVAACIALDQPAATCAWALCGVWTAAWRLHDLRQRTSIISAAVVTAGALAAATLVLSGLLRPMSGPALGQAVWEALGAGGAALLVGFVVLGTLPWIERLLGVTTGMTLIELRDPRHPLLRLLQQRAPGTYTHALNVANLAEAAAESVRADGLLTYVGALYHDVGKLNKPEFFVENQTGGLNRHDKLAPAMSLLVIVGHVKEGVELAREHRLPTPLLHFIEAHHGTTLVEYFYHRARKAAEAAGNGHGPGPGGSAAGGAAGAPGPAVVMPQEIEYRYPGPRPRTRECAIVMICDAAESAARALTDPSPARLDSLVRAIAHKRLMDGQFDECELTLRDLSAIIDTVSRSLAALHHARVNYPEPPAPRPSAPANASANASANAPAPAVGAPGAPAPQASGTPVTPSSPVVAPAPATQPVIAALAGSATSAASGPSR